MELIIGMSLMRLIPPGWRRMVLTKRKRERMSGKKWDMRSIM
jgi:hypothetical protein